MHVYVAARTLGDMVRFVLKKIFLNGDIVSGSDSGDELLQCRLVLADFRIEQNGCLETELL